ncbi:4'-phosphopantetheinyl transferase family protein [Streptacidiphilus albus]|uniref:4'-phosphopantetheinyl transferase family protein n=1 Tax=Streptacidiphilus albus TaxID=105425 RepID=UPI0005AA56D0|nr:4'-phosphopantetheinyl transferase superfamily protein [Streptacidiphilus albus]
MTAAERSRSVQPFGPLIRIAGRDGPWHRIGADLAAYGTALVYARTGDWRPDQAPGPRLRALLGRDWSRYLDLSRPDVRNRFAASRVLLKYAAGAALQVAPESLELGYRSTGRPYLRGNDALDISLSHTEGLLLVGLTTSGFIGVDVEDARREFHEAGLARHWCTPDELARIEALAPELRDPALVRLWTLKESYSKALGLGMQFRFTDFGFDYEHDGRITARTVEDAPVGPNDWAFQSYALDDDFTVSSAVYNVGFGSTDDTAAHTMLDLSLFDAVASVLGDEESAADAGESW